MKKLFLFIILFYYQSAKAQDTIIKFDEEQIISKIIEITPREVKYKKFTFQDGPTYVEEKSAIRSIKYSNGAVSPYSCPIHKSGT